MKIDLYGKTAIVTGSTDGIGFAIARGLALCGAIRTEFVGDHDARGPHLLPDQFTQKTLGGGFVSAALDQNIKLNPVLIDGPPEPLLRSADRDDNFI